MKNRRKTNRVVTGPVAKALRILLREPGAIHRLCLLAGIPCSNVYRWWHGKADLTLGTADKLFKAAGIIALYRVVPWKKGW